jgi:hypothetical protein
VWFNMQDEKLAAELSGKNATQSNLGFGRTGLSVAPRMALPKVPDPAALPAAPAAGAPRQSAGKAPAVTNAAAAAANAAAVQQEEAAAAAAAAALAEAQAQAAAEMQARPWPAFSFRDTYLVTGGPIVSAEDAARNATPPTANLTATLTGTTPPVAPLATPPSPAPTAPSPPPPLTIPGAVQPPPPGTPSTPPPGTPPGGVRTHSTLSLQDSSGKPPDCVGYLYLYKLDAIARMLLPEEMAGTASKSLLNRMLADLNPPKIRRRGQPDPAAAAPKPPSAMRKAADADPDAELGGRRHIKFNEADLEGLLNEEQKSGACAHRQSTCFSFVMLQRPASLQHRPLHNCHCLRRQAVQEGNHQGRLQRRAQQANRWWCSQRRP